MPKLIVSGIGTSGCGDTVVAGVMVAGASVATAATVVMVVAVAPTPSVGTWIVCGRGGGGMNPEGCSHCDSRKKAHVCMYVCISL